MGRPADGHDLRFNLHPFSNQHRWLQDARDPSWEPETEPFSNRTRGSCRKNRTVCTGFGVKTGPLLLPSSSKLARSSKLVRMHGPQHQKKPKTKIPDTSAIFWEFRAENPFSEVPQSSCIVWDTQGPFLRHVYFFNFRPARQKPTKICRNGYLFPFPWRTAPRTLPKSKSARLEGP